MTLAQEFPRRATADLCKELFGRPRELRQVELALQWLYMEEAGEVAYCPPRAGIDIRRDIRATRIRVRRARKQAA